MKKTKQIDEMKIAMIKDLTNRENISKKKVKKLVENYIES